MKIHNKNVDLTYCFSELNTKFYTGGTDGNIKIWDFNGHCYYTLDASNGGSCEITQILGIKRRIITVGWSKYTSNSSFRLLLLTVNFFKRNNCISR